MRGTIAAACAALAFSFLATTASAAMWKFIDEKGSAHFVPERAQIPPRFRDKAVEVGASGSAGALTVSAATTPPPAGAATAPQPPPQQVAAPVSAEAQNGTDASADIHEIEQGKAPYAQQAKALNQLNPLSGDAAPAGGQNPDMLASLPPQLQFVGKFMTDPRVQRTSQALTNPENMGYIKAIQENPDRNVIFYVSGAALLVVMYLRWKVQQSEMGFVAQLISKIVLAGLLLGCSVAISYYVYGEPLVKLLTNLWKAAMA